MNDFNYTLSNLEYEGLDDEQIFETVKHIKKLAQDYSLAKHQKKVALPKGFSSYSPEEKGKFFEDNLWKNLMEADLSKTLDDTVLPKSMRSSQREAVKEAVFSIARNLVSMYANSASTTIIVAEKKDEIIVNSPNPRFAAAQKEIVLTKTLNSDGTYNTTYSVKNSDDTITYDKNGNVISRTSPALDTLSRKLFESGYNAQYLENGLIWFSPDAFGKTPESTVKAYTIRTRTDESYTTTMAEIDQIIEDYQKTHAIDHVENVSISEAEQNATLSMEEATQNLAILSEQIKQTGVATTEIDVVATVQALYPTATTESAWTKVLTVAPELFAYLPSEYFADETSKAKEYLEISRQGLKNIYAQKEKISETDVKEVSNISVCIDEKITLEQERIKEQSSRKQIDSIIENMGREK